jgi:hypothetical protein
MPHISQFSKSLRKYWKGETTAWANLTQHMDQARKEVEGKKTEKLRQKQEACRDWLAMQFETGTTAAYRMVKYSDKTTAFVPTQYGPSDALLHHLEHQTNQWAKLWEAGGKDEQGEILHHDEGTKIPEPCSPEHLRQNCKRHKNATAAVEGIHPKWVGNLSDAALRSLAKVYGG